MERVVLIHPPSIELRYTLWDVFDLPFNLLATAIMAQREFDVKIIDCRVNPAWKSELIEELGKKPICVGVSVIASHVLNSIKISEFIKHKADVPVVWGGAIPQVAPEMVLEERCVDIIVTGEGEITFYELCKALKNKDPLSNILGIGYKEDGRIKLNAPRPYINLDNFADLPFHLIEMNRYGKYLKGARFSMETSRSCTNQCTFCINAIKVKEKPYISDHTVYRAMSADVVLERIQFLIRNYGVSTISMMDENLFCDLERCEKICKGIIERGLKISWLASTDPRQSLDAGLIRLVKKSGCTHLNMGVDSGSPRIRKLLNRDNTIEEVYRVSDIMQKEGIPLFYFFMAGLPTETDNDLRQTMDLMVSLLRRYPENMVAHCSIYCPWPNTPMFTEAVKNGLRPPRRIADYDIDPFRGVNYHSNAKFLNYLTGSRFRKLQTISFAAHFIDDKVKFFNYPWWMQKIVIFLKRFSRYRIEKDYFKFQFEPFVWKMVYILGRMGIVKKIFSGSEVISKIRPGKKGRV